MNICFSNHLTYPEQSATSKLKMFSFRASTRSRVAGILLQRSSKRTGTTSASPRLSKAAGDISSVFPSLSGLQSPPLPPRFADLKRRIIKGHEERVWASWERLLAALRQEIDVIKALGSRVIPEIEFRDMHNMEKRTAFGDGLRKRGVGLIRGVVSEREALGWKELLKRYIQTNPSTKGRQPSHVLHLGLVLLPLLFICFRILAKYKRQCFGAITLWTGAQGA